MEIDKLRKIRFKRLVAQLGGVSAAAKELGMTVSHVSMLANPDNPRTIGTPLARRIETAMGMQPGTLDQAADSHGREAVRIPLVMGPQLRPWVLNKEWPRESPDDFLLWDGQYDGRSLLSAQRKLTPSLAPTIQVNDIMIWSTPTDDSGQPTVILNPIPGQVYMVVAGERMASRYYRETEDGLEFYATHPDFSVIKAKDLSECDIVAQLVEVRFSFPRA
jgi:hypothetical protein